MSEWAWLSTCLAEKQGIFGEIHQCLTFESSIQSFNPLLIQSPKVISSMRDINEYLDNLEKTQPDVCVMAFTNSSAANNGKLPLPISKTLFERIATLFNLAPSFLHILSTGLAMFSSSISPESRTNNKGWENAQYVIQQNRAYSAFSIALTFSISTGKSRILIFGAEPWVVSNMFQFLASMPSHPYGPMVIPTVAMELQAQWFNETVGKLQGQLHSIEAITGMRQFNFPHEVQGTSPQDWKSLDLISITRDLSSFLSRFAFLKLQAETGVYLVDRMRKTTELLLGEIQEQHREDGHSGAMADDQNNIILKLEGIRSWYLGLVARCNYLTERATAQNQTVYCLIASQFNLTDIDIARASRNIAEETRKENEAMRTIAEVTRQDNELMIQIAKDSRSIAIATAQDSAAMQVIAIMTILFLPPTFTATFFSMTFFNFSDATKPSVSPWSWIYVLVTVTLTIVIQSTWAIMSRKRKAKITQTIPSLDTSISGARL